MNCTLPLNKKSLFKHFLVNGIFHHWLKLLHSPVSNSRTFLTLKTWSKNENPETKNKFQCNVWIDGRCAASHQRSRPCVPHLSCFMTFELFHYGTTPTAFLLFIFYLPVPVKAVECVLYFFK